MVSVANVLGREVVRHSGLVAHNSNKNESMGSGRCGMLGVVLGVLVATTAMVGDSQQLFPTKAVAVWRSCSDSQRAQLIGQYLDQTGTYEDIQSGQLVAADSGYDPLVVVSARTKIT